MAAVTKTAAVLVTAACGGPAGIIFPTIVGGAGGFVSRNGDVELFVELDDGFSPSPRPMILLA